MTEIKPHSSHWGAFDAVVENGRLVAARPFAWVALVRRGVAGCQAIPEVLDVVRVALRPAERVPTRLTRAAVPEREGHERDAAQSGY